MGRVCQLSVGQERTMRASSEQSQINDGDDDDDAHSGQTFKTGRDKLLLTQARASVEACRLHLELK